MQSSGATDRPDQQDPPDPGPPCKVDDFARVVDDKALRSGESRCDAKEDRRTQRRNITTVHVNSTRQGCAQLCLTGEAQAYRRGAMIKRMNTANSARARWVRSVCPRKVYMNIFT
jgi:hypothetical protein